MAITDNYDFGPEDWGLALMVGAPPQTRDIGLSAKAIRVFSFPCFLFYNNAHRSR